MPTLPTLCIRKTLLQEMLYQDKYKMPDLRTLPTLCNYEKTRSVRV